MQNSRRWRGRKSKFSCRVSLPRRRSSCCLPSNWMWIKNTACSLKSRRCHERTQSVWKYSDKDGQKLVLDTNERRQPCFQGSFLLATGEFLTYFSPKVVNFSMKANRKERALHFICRGLGRGWKGWGRPAFCMSSFCMSSFCMSSFCMSSRYIFGV